MIELPEAAVLANQLNIIVSGRKVRSVRANSSPHKFAWFSGDPAEYEKLLKEKTTGSAVPHGGMVELEIGDHRLLFSDGINLRFLKERADLPKKHQLLLEFHDGTLLCASVQMYGGLWCFKPESNDNPYYLAARELPSPLTEEFTMDYFLSLEEDEKVAKKSVKAFLATDQRIPGLGNGVLQDILFNARVHPKRRWNSLGAEERTILYEAIKTTLKEMTALGGRDTETGLSGEPGGYATKMSRKSVGTPCGSCGTVILKEPYMGGSIYFCPRCQPL